MPRNLYRRVETLFPVEDESIKSSLREEILNIHLQDNVKARKMLPDGSYENIALKDGEEPLDSQEWMIHNRGIWHHME
jgi:polyphosphate kinase